MDDYTMDAYVVPIQDAASADEQGLLRHMVRQYMNEVCPLEVFGLPAMQVWGSVGRCGVGRDAGMHDIARM